MPELRVLWLSCLLTACAAPLPELDPVADADLATGGAGGPDGIPVLEAPEAVEAGALPAHLDPRAAMALALRHDARLQQSIANARAQLAAATAARRWPNPVLDLTFKFPEGGGAPMLEAGLAASVVRMLATPQRAAAADAALRAACAEVVATALDVAAAAEARCYAVQSGAARLQLLQQRQQTSRQLVELARARVAAGETAQLEVLELDALRVTLELEIVDRERELASDRLALLRQLGAPGGADLPELTPWVAPPPLAAGETELVAAALQARPEVQSAAQGVAAAEAEAALQGFQPFEDAALLGMAERDGMWRAGPSLSVPLPLFDGGSPQRARARAELLARGHARTDVLRQIVAEVRIAFRAQRSAEQNLQRVVQELLPLQQQRRAQAEALYRAGQTDATPLLLAEQDLLAAQDRRVDLEREVGQQRTALVRAVGGARAFAGSGKAQAAR